MKRTWKMITDFFCAVMFCVNAWGFGVEIGLREGRGYYILLGLIWLAGGLIWAVRGVHALKANNNE